MLKKVKVLFSIATIGMVLSGNVYGQNSLHDAEVIGSVFNRKARSNHY